MVARYLVIVFEVSLDLIGVGRESPIPFPTPNLQIFCNFLSLSLWNGISLVLSVSVPVSSHCSMVDSLCFSLQLIPSSLSLSSYIYIYIYMSLHGGGDGYTPGFLNAF